MNEEQILTIDIGNGGVKSAVFYCNQFFTSIFFPKYATGDRNLSVRRGELADYGIDPAINGNTQDLFITREGTTYYLGLSAHTVDGTIIRETGFSRYSQVEHMQNMLLGSLKGLFNAGWLPEAENEITLGIGMPPQWYYDDKSYNSAYDTFEKAFLNNSFSVAAKGIGGGIQNTAVFKIIDIAVMSEAIGGYYDHMFDEGVANNFTELGDPSVGALVVDIGFGTLDCAIIKDYKLGSINELLTDPKLGCHQLFATAVEKLDSRYNDFDELELLFHTGQSRLDLSRKEFRSMLDKVIPNYLSTIRSRVARKYIHSRRGLFSQIIIMGGITKIIPEDELVRSLSFDDVEVIVADEFSNVRGYNKLLRDEAA